MKTQSNKEVKNFEKLKTPVPNGRFESWYYKGVVEYKGKDVTVYWDKSGKCANKGREDYFLNLKSK